MCSIWAETRTSVLSVSPVGSVIWLSKKKVHNYDTRASLVAGQQLELCASHVLGTRTTPGGPAQRGGTPATLAAMAQLPGVSNSFQGRRPPGGPGGRDMRRTAEQDMGSRRREDGTRGGAAAKA